jgi:hypothetical protein
MTSTAPKERTLSDVEAQLATCRLQLQETVAEKGRMIKARDDAFAELADCERNREQLLQENAELEQEMADLRHELACTKEVLEKSHPAAPKIFADAETYLRECKPGEVIPVPALNMPWQVWAVIGTCLLFLLAGGRLVYLAYENLK